MKQNGGGKKSILKGGAAKMNKRPSTMKLSSLMDKLVCTA